MSARRREDADPRGLLGPDSVLSPPRTSRSVWAGLAGVALVTGADIALGSRAVLVSALSVVVLAVAVFGRRGDAAVVGAVSVLVAALSGLWNGWGLGYVVGVVVVAAASAVAVVVTLGRDSAEATGRQLALLRELLELGRDRAGVATIAERVLAALVPRLADFAWLDLELEGEARRIGTPAGGGGDALRLPLATTGAPFGELSLAVGPSGRRYGPRDAEFSELAAGRVAVILENAGLTLAAAQTERRMISALDTLGEAVTMNGPDGRTVYANEAAARLLRVERPEELYTPQVGEISRRFAIYDEAGEPVDFRDLPAFKALAGEDDPPAMLVRNIVRATGEERWLVNRVTVLRDHEGRVDRVVNVIENVTEVKQAELRQRLLADATRALSGSLDYEQTLQRVAEVAVPRLADWCGVDLLGRGGTIDPVAIAHRDPARREAGRELRERYPVRLDSDTELARVIREGGSALIPSVGDDDVVAFAVDEAHLALLREVGFASIAIVPLVAGGEPLGAITLVRSDPLRRFSAADLALAEEIGQRAGIALLNARLFSERSRIARELQAGIKPAELPAVPGVEVAALYRPAGELNEVGGDFYDVFPTPAGWMLVIGDVEGQGARAAALTSLARYTLRSVAQLTGDPVRAAAQLNRTLRDQPQMSLCTVAAVLLRAAADGAVELAALACGHPVPVLVRDGAPVELGTPSALLGAFDDADPRLTVSALRDGDGLVLYTDGVLDTAGAGGRFEKQRLLALLEGGEADPGRVIERVDAALGAFQVGAQRDDTAVLALTLRDGRALTGAAARPAGSEPAR
jgi:serine phosphatase RsbU (regulator of sigma subunit)/PAS domain-containing protein